jgi:alpha-glucosidase (family GH31 glycosyl hydrolase)
MGTYNVTELEAHTLFGTMEVKATHDWFKQQGNRTMIIERSAYAGTGKFASRWLGDNFSQEKYMGFSITGIMAQNIMGIQLVGSDICGFQGDTNAELCARWHVVGSFYPFSRNHNSWDTIGQEPYRWTEFYEDGIQYLDIMKRAIYNKYNLVRYYYTEMSIHSEEGGTFIKPLFFEFPDDISSVWDQENNLMIGSALKLGILSN